MENKEEEQAKFNYADLTIEDILLTVTKGLKSVSNEEGEHFIKLWDELAKTTVIRAVLVPELIELGMISEKKGLDPLYSIFCYSYLIGFVGGIDYVKNKYKIE